MAIIRLRYRWASALATGVGIAAAVTVAGAISLLQAVAAESSVQITIRNLGDGAWIDIQRNASTTEADYQAFQEDAIANVDQELGTRYSLAGRHVESRELYASEQNGASLKYAIPVQFATYEGLIDHVHVVAGSWPAEPMAAGAYWVTLSEQAAANLHLQPGDNSCFHVLDHENEYACTRVAAIWRPRDIGSAYWGSETVPGNFLELERPQLLEILQKKLRHSSAASVHAVFSPNPAAFHAPDEDQIVAGIQRLRSTYAIQRLDNVVTTRADTAIQNLRDRSAVAQFAVRLVAVQMLVIVLYYVAFVARHGLDQQRQLFGVLRSRGWSRSGIWLLLMLEYGLIALLALPTGLAAAWLLTAGAGSLVYGTDYRPPPSLPQDQGMNAAVAVAVALVVLGYSAFSASRRELPHVRSELSRPQTRPWWQWRYLDLALALLSIPLLLQVRLLGQSQLRAAGWTGNDPTSLVLPGLALTFIALAALRLLPVAANVSALLGRGLDHDLAHWQLSRHPVQHARLALLLAMTVALGTFSSVYAATASRNGLDRAAYAAGADLRVSFQGENPFIDSLLEPLNGVRASTLTWRGNGRAGHFSGDQPVVLAVDPYEFEQIAWSRPDLTQEPLPALMRRLVADDPGGLIVPGRPSALGIWAFSTGVSARLRARITDAQGRSCDCDLGMLDQPGWRYLQAPIDIPRMSYPLKLRHLEIRAAPSGRAGEVALSDLSVATGNQLPQVVERFDEENNFEALPTTPSYRPGAGLAWSLTATITGRQAGLLHASGAHTRENRLTTAFSVTPGDGTVLIRPPLTQAPIPILVPTNYLHDLGVREGRQFPLNVDAIEVRVAVVGLVDHFPTLYPEATPFIVVPRDSLLAELSYDGHRGAWPNEAWLNVKLASVSLDAATLRSNRAQVAEVWSRSERETSNRHDAQQLGLESSLLIGFLGAIGLAVVGFVVHFVITTRGRLSEYAILQANGMPRALIHRSLGAEQVVLMAFSVLAGSAIGLLLAWVLLPSIQLSTDLTELVPATIVTVNPALSAGAVAALAVLALAAGALSSRLAGRFYLMDELRLLA